MMIRFVLLFVFFRIFDAYSSTIDKAFQALNRKDYYTANQLFIKSVKKNPSISYFGLTQLYLNHDYLNLDSAYNYILYSEKTFSLVTEKKRLKYVKYNFDSLAIQSWKQRVSDNFFELEKNNLSEKGLQKFIDKNKWSRHIENAVILRDSIAFYTILKIDSSYQTINFLTKYSNSIYAEKARNLLLNQQYNESTREGKLFQYENFLNQFPDNYHVKDAENRIYELVTSSGDINAFIKFIKKYPRNSNMNAAWRQLYRIYMSDFEISKFDSFEREFPDFPFKEELKQDKRVFLENYFPVAIGEKYGFMNSSGSIAIYPQYDEVGTFKNGLAVVSKNSKFGVITKKNELIVDFIYDEIVDYIDDRAIVLRGDTYNLIDYSGKEVCTESFKDLTNFSLGIYIGLKDSIYQFLDKNLTVISDLNCQEIQDLIDGYCIIQVDDYYGVIDSNLQVKIPFQYDEIQRFDKNTFIYTLNNKKGLISTQGFKLTEPLFDEISELNLENNSAVVKTGPLISWIKNDGTKLVEFSTEFFPNALEIAQFSKGYAIYRKKGKYGFIDDKAKSVFKPALEITSKFINAIPALKNGKWGLIDFKNKAIIPFEFDLIEDWKGKGILVQKNGLSGLWDYKFSTILPLEFNSIKVFDNQYYIVTKGSKCGLYDFTGKEIIPVIYDRIRLFEKDCLTLVNEDEISYYFVRTNNYLKYTK